MKSAWFVSMAKSAKTIIQIVRIKTDRTLTWVPTCQLEQNVEHNMVILNDCDWYSSTISSKIISFNCGDDSVIEYKIDN